MKGVNLTNYENPTLKEYDGLLVWQTPQFGKEEGVLQFFTTRLGGVSRPPYHSLNLSFATEDEPYAIQENRSMIEASFQARLTKWANQVHGANILIIEKKLSLDSMEDIPENREADAFITRISGVPLSIYFADCVPVFIFDPVVNVIAIVHAGWRGTVQGITRKTVETMQSKYGTNPENILATIGPSIGPCCFEVQADVLEKFTGAFHYWPQIVKKTKSHSSIDLWQANFLQLREIGVLPENVFISQLCTSCNYDLFFSYRRDRGTTGRMAGVIMLQD